MARRPCTLATECSLQVRHKQGSRDSFPCNIADHNRDAILAQLEKIIIIATHGTRLEADSRTIESRNGRRLLWKQSCLHLLRNFEIVRRQEFGLATLGFCPPLCLNRTRYIVEA